MKINAYKPVHPPQNRDLDAQLREASRLYEKQFIGEMVKAMRATISHTNEPSMAEKIYTDQIYDSYVDKWTENGGVGLADIIYGQLRERFYPEQRDLKAPVGPMPLDKGTRLKVDETTDFNQPLPLPENKEKLDMSYLFEFAPAPGRPISAPWDGRVEQVIRQDGRQTVKLAHSNGMISTLSFRGITAELERGMTVTAGQRLGTVAPDASGLVWRVGLGPA